MKSNMIANTLLIFLALLLPSVEMNQVLRDASLSFPFDESKWDLLFGAEVLENDKDASSRMPRIRLVSSEGGENESISIGAIRSRSPLPESLFANDSEWRLDALFTGRTSLNGYHDVAVLFATNESISANPGTSNAVAGEGFGVAVSTNYGRKPLQPEITVRSGISGSETTKAFEELVSVKCWASTDLLSRSIKLTFEKRKNSEKLLVRYSNPCGESTELTLDLEPFLAGFKNPIHLGAVVITSPGSGLNLDLTMLKFSELENVGDSESIQVDKLHRLNITLDKLESSVFPTSTPAVHYSTPKARSAVHRKFGKHDIFLSVVHSQEDSNESSQESRSAEDSSESSEEDDD